METTWLDILSSVLQAVLAAVLPVLAVTAATWMLAKWKEPGATAVLEHGANPGLISHWTKRGLLDIAAAVVAEKKVKGAQAEKIAHLAQTQVFNELAMALGVLDPHLPPGGLIARRVGRFCWGRDSSSSWLFSPIVPGCSD